MIKHRRTVIASVVAGAAIVGHAPGAVAQVPATINISVDATGAGTPLERIWAFHGYDEVNYTTVASGKALLTTLGSIYKLPPHIRTHFLLNTGNGVPSFKWGSTNVYTADVTGNPIYDWTLMDGIMDTITSAHTLPFVEIGFMPQALTVHPNPYQNSGIYVNDGGCFYPPNDYVKWGALISSWATHSSSRYTSVEKTWQWELWNEPDGSYWKGTPAEYDKLFDYTEAALHQVLPNTQLGGPAVAGVGAFLTQFLQHCAGGTNAVGGKAGTRLDMVTFHAKGGVAMVGGHVQMNLGHQLDLHRNGFNVVAGFPQFKQTPIVVSEADPDGCAACPVSQTPADAYRNSPAYGAYEVAMMKKTLDLEASVGVKVQGLLTWAFLFEKQPYFAGYRVLSSNDIHLPVLNAFKLLGSLDGNRVPVTSSGALTADQIITNSVRQQADVDAMATVNGRQVQILVWNYHDDLVMAPASPIHLSVQVPAAFGASATITHMRVDDTHGDAHAVWVSQGSPAAPSATQLIQLQQAMEPTPLQAPQKVPVAGNAVSIDFALPRFGLSLVTLVPAGLAPVGDASAADSSSSGGSGGGGPGAGVPGVDASLPDDGAASVDATLSGSGSSSGGGSSTGAGAPLADGSTGAGGPPPSMGSASNEGGATPSGSGAASGCACALAIDRLSARTADETVLGLILGLPTIAAIRRRRTPGG